jgi:hypothetical protein
MVRYGEEQSKGKTPQIRVAPPPERWEVARLDLVATSQHPTRMLTLSESKGSSLSHPTRMLILSVVAKGH